MWDDILDLVLFVVDDIIDFFRTGWKEKKERKNRQKEEDERQRKADRERPL